MVGGGFIPTSHADDYDLDEIDAGSALGAHAVQWVGTPAVKGPKWAKLPLLTVGMLGIQCVWSIEMGYASPYLLDLGLSKPLMSLVFMAGPLSGLIVQPLIGIFADRSKSKYGRRRPFMLMGCAISAVGMFLLGYAREISGFFGGGSGFAIFIAVWAIYLIDFSINAVMSTDRALVVDTLPPSQQEEGSAWAGRMFGVGSVAGFFIGTLDLTSALAFLGKTQLQILSFITAFLLLAAHGFTSWAVTERVLLRDDRPSSKGGFLANLKAIWENIFTLPPGIRTVCTVQFFASLGWFPILFFTSVWVSEIYKSSHPELDPEDPGVKADAVRAGATSLLIQSLVSMTCSVCLPFIVDTSGVQPEEQQYSSLASTGAPPNSAVWKRTQEEVMSGGLWRRFLGAVQEIVSRVKDGERPVQLPIKGFTLIRLWTISQSCFALIMAASWFVSSVTGAYCVIGMTGFCWATYQWAPFSVLGELILIESTIDRTTGGPQITRTRASFDDLEHRPQASSPPPYPPTLPEATTSARTTPSHSRTHSRNSPSLLSRLSFDNDKDSLRQAKPDPANGLYGPSPTLSQNEGFDNSIILYHSADHEEDFVERRSSSSMGLRPRSASPAVKGNTDTANKAGVILGIHNVFLVLPQFIVTFLSSIIFYLMEPDKSIPAHPPAGGVIPIHNATGLGGGDDAGLGDGDVAIDAVRLLARMVTSAGEGMTRWSGRSGAGAPVAGSSDAVGLIFRIGGVSAAIGAFLTYRMSKAWARGEGI